MPDARINEANRSSIKRFCLMKSVFGRSGSRVLGLLLAALPLLAGQASAARNSSAQLGTDPAPTPASQPGPWIIPAPQLPPRSRVPILNGPVEPLAEDPEWPTGFEARLS